MTSKSASHCRNSGLATEGPFSCEHGLGFKLGTRRTNAADRISHREPHAVCGGNDTAKLENRPDRKNMVYDMLFLSRVWGRDETFVRADTAREKRDRHLQPST